MRLPDRFADYEIAAIAHGIGLGSVRQIVEPLEVLQMRQLFIRDDRLAQTKEPRRAILVELNVGPAVGSLELEQEQRPGAGE